MSGVNDLSFVSQGMGGVQPNGLAGALGAWGGAAGNGGYQGQQGLPDWQRWLAMRRGGLARGNAQPPTGAPTQSDAAPPPMQGVAGAPPPPPDQAATQANWTPNSGGMGPLANKQNALW